MNIMVIRNGVGKRNWKSNRRGLFERIKRNEEKGLEDFVCLDELD